ncbi:MAG: hypothetical protein MUO76_03700 [Anaerolineaceae bacterium]|nr:hypothetical protein [Anaerolineaceae bacterium]
MQNNITDLKTLAALFSGDSRVVEGKWFGKICLKVNGKTFTVLFGRDVAFKLPDDALKEALQIDGAHLFDPRGKGNPFKEWVQVPAKYAGEWPALAHLSLEFVSNL